MMKIFKFEEGQYGYVLRHDGQMEGLFDKAIYPYLRPEFMEEGCYQELTSSEQNHYDFLINSGVSELYEQKGARVRGEAVKAYPEVKENLVTTQKSEKMKMSKMFGNVKMGKLSGDQFAVAMNMGIAIKAKDGQLYTYDAENDQLVNQAEFAFPMKNAFFGLPVAYNQVKAGDVIIDQKDRALFVKEVNRAGKLKCTNPETGGETTVVKTSHIMFGTQFVTKVTSLMSMMGAQPGQTPSQATAQAQAQPGNPFGQINPMMFMMMNDDEGDSESLLPLIMMANMGGQNGQQGGINPLMMMMMMKGDKSEKGGKSGFGGDMVEMMMMSQMFQGGNAANAANPFGGLFGQPAANVVEEPEAEGEETEEED